MTSVSSGGGGGGNKARNKGKFNKGGGGGGRNHKEFGTHKKDNNSSNSSNNAAASATGAGAGSGGGGGDENHPANACVADRPGPEVSDGALLQSITSKQNAMMQPTLTITMYIQTQSVGAVIGRRGQTIANLQKAASQAASTKQPVRVSVVGQDASDATTSFPCTYSELDFSNPEWTPVIVRADPRAAFTAANQLHDVVLGVVDDVVVDVPVNRSKHSAIVGKRGLTLQNISADTGVRIMVPPKELKHDVIQLEGDLHRVKQCLDRILQVVSAPSNKGGNVPKGNNKDSTNEERAGNSNKGEGPQQLAPSAAKSKATKDRNSNKQQAAAAAAAPAAAATDAPSAAAGPAAVAAAAERISQTIVVNQLPSQTKLRSIGRKTDTSIKKRKSNDSWQLTVTGTRQEQLQNAIDMLRKWNNDNHAKTNKQQQESAAPAAGKDAAGSDESAKAATKDGQQQPQQQQQQQKEGGPKQQEKQQDVGAQPPTSPKGGAGVVAGTDEKPPSQPQKSQPPPSGGRNSSYRGGRGGGGRGGGKRNSSNKGTPKRGGGGRGGGGKPKPPGGGGGSDGGGGGGGGGGGD